jgi:gluconokinase
VDDGERLRLSFAAPIAGMTLHDSEGGAMGRQEDVVVGVDIGTTSTKAVAFTVDGEARATGRAGYELRSPHPGWEEQDARAVVAAVVEATAAAVREARGAGHGVAGLAFSAAMHSLIGLDGAGEPVTPLLTWADARAVPQARALRDAGDALALQRRTGTPVHPMSPMVKLRWFAEEAPEVAGRVAHWVGIKELVLRGLTGELAVDFGIASATGLFNLEAEEWDAGALACAGIDAHRLPAPVPTTTVLPLTADGAAAVGLEAGIPVVIGCSDGPLANLGLGAIRPGAVACSIGTSGAVRAVVDAPRMDDRGRSFCYILDAGRYVVGGAINNGGIVLDWCGDALAPELEEPAAEALLELAARVPAGSGGLLFLPYLLGERAPHWSGRPRGAYLGLTREHGRGHLVRAALEGVSLQLAVVLGSLDEAGIEVREIRATGGFARSPLWRSIVASAFGRPIGFAESPEGSALGAALLGMTALGMLDSLDRAAELVAVDHVEEPVERDAEVYAALIGHFDAAFELLAPTFAALADAQALLPFNQPEEIDG